jgi:hypothetical protein
MSTTTAKISLYDVALEGAEINDILSANDGELTPELEARFDELLRQGPRKIDAACMVVRELSATAEACRAEAKRLTERATAFDRNEAVLKSRILGAVDAAFDGKLKTQMFTVWGQTSAMTLKFEPTEGLDLEKLAAEFPQFVRTKRELNVSALKEAWQSPITVIPSELVDCAVESEGTRYLRIK